MIPEQFKEPIEDIYNCPIETSISQIHMMVNDEYDRQIIKAVGQIGIEIDKNGLLEALNADRKRYNAAYKQGWEDCKKQYIDRLKQISELAMIGVDQE